VIPGLLPPPQEEAITRLYETTEHIAVYSVDHLGDGFVIVHGQLITQGSVVTILRIVEPDGTFQLVSDGLNQFHWLQDIEANRFPLLGKRTLNRAVRAVRPDWLYEARP
jgi:GDP-D-mannose dehydratase